MYKHFKPGFQKIFKILPYIGLVLCFAQLCFLMQQRVNCLLDSDMSSELILSRLLAGEGGILSPNWYYSTEIRVFNTQLVFSRLFLLTQDWHAVRVWGSVILYIIMLLSALYFCRKAKIARAFPFVGAALLLPFSDAYFLLVLRGVGYVTHIAISFFTLGLLFHFAGAAKRPVQIALLCLAGMVSLLTGMNGLRQMFVLYLPLTCTVALLFFISVRTQDSFRTSRWFRPLLFSSWSTAFALVGYMINRTVLGHNYNFFNYESIQYQSPYVSSIEKVFNGWIDALGYRTDAAIFSFTTIGNLLSILLLASMLICAIAMLAKRTHCTMEALLVAGYFLVAMAFFLGLYLLTDMDYHNSYALPILVMGFPLLALCMQSSKTRAPWKRMIVIGLCFMMAFSSMSTYRKWYRTDQTAELREIVSKIEDFGCTEGYATFWNANVLTELSNGDISVRCWGGSYLENDGSVVIRTMDGAGALLAEDTISVDKLDYWLQPKMHAETVPEGKVFCLFAERERQLMLARQLDEQHIIYQSKNYTLYGYDSYRSLTQQVSKKFIFPSNNQQWLINGEEVDGVRYLYTGGISYGPYIDLYPGTYRVEMLGTNLDAARVDCICNEAGETVDLAIQNLNVTSTKITYDLLLDRTHRKVETRVHNDTDHPVSITARSIVRFDG